MTRCIIEYRTGMETETKVKDLPVTFGDNVSSVIKQYRNGDKVEISPVK